MYTGFDPAEESSVLRRGRDGSRSSFPCPIATAEYNKHMGGVDRGDQLRGYYGYKMKSRKFYRYIANFLIGVSITNAFILYRSGHPGSKMRLKEYHQILGTELIGDYCTKKIAGRVGHQIQPLPFRHFPTKVAYGNAARKRGRCQHCSEKKKRSTTQWFCQDCGVWLCHTGTENDCFLLWHKRRV